jgi:hypothetical protein
MIDPELLADLRRLVNALRLPEWQRDLEQAVPSDLVKQISEDFRNYNISPRSPLNTPAQTVSVVGAGKVVGADDVPVASGGTGWVDSPEIKNWKPPGLELMDRMMDQQDAIDRAERIRQLAEASAIRQAEAEIKAQAEQPKPKGPKA